MKYAIELNLCAFRIQLFKGAPIKVIFQYLGMLITFVYSIFDSTYNFVTWIYNNIITTA